MKIIYLLFLFFIYSGCTYSKDLHPEERLLDAIQDIQLFDLDKAEVKLAALVKEMPDFKLAQMVYADVLSAKIKVIPDVGTGINNGLDKLLLLMELKNRYAADKDIIVKHNIPSVFVNLDTFYRHAIVVDLSKSRLYLFDNLQKIPLLVDDFFVSMGRKGAGKNMEGDLKTPLGVYFIESHIGANKLVDKYGDGAYPINYPNLWDRYKKRSGSGIWLHGTRSGTYNRPALASEGCVVLPNEDLNKISRYINIQNTPFIIGENIEWLDIGQWKQQRAERSQLIENWKADWESLDVERYLKHYSTHFKNGKNNFNAWAKHKKRVSKNKKKIQIELSHVSFLRYPNENVMVVTYLQSYKSDNYSSQDWKRQYWNKESDGQWRIVFEDKIPALKEVFYSQDKVAKN